MIATTSLHISYQPKLGLLWALRELGSNAIDGETRNRHLGVGKMHITYSKRTQTLSILNEDIEVPISMFCMGKSESRDDDACIGTHGEGGPLSCLILARNHVPVTIYSGDERWIPEIHRSKDFQGEPILVINRRKLRKPRKDYEVIVEQVSEELYAEFCLQYLRMDPSYDPAMTVDIPGSGQRVLLQPQFHGRIYNKGVFVTHRSDLLYGYDLNQEVNRDRNFMDEWTLKSNLGRLLASAVNHHNERFTEVLASALVETNGVLEVTDEWSDVVYNTTIASRIAAIFIDKYGDNAIAVDTTEQSQEAETLGFKGIVCSPLVRKVLDRKVGSLAEVKARRQSSVVRTWLIDEMGQQERVNFVLATRLVQSVVPQCKDMQFEATSFLSKDVKYLVKVEDQKVIHLAYDHLLDLDRTILSAAQGATGTDPSLVLAKMVSQLVSGSNSTAALVLLATV